MQRSITAAVACMFAVASIVGPVSAATNTNAIVAQAQPQQATLTGRVTTASGAPLSGATVNATGNGRTSSATTAGDGSFSLNLAPGLYTVVVSRGGYQDVSNDVAITTQSTMLAIALPEASLNNLQVIGRTASGANRNGAQFNITSSAQSRVTEEQIRARNNPDIATYVGQLPAVTISNSATNVNRNFVVRGLANETRVTLDGHPLSSGVSGQLITNYSDSALFSGVNVEKGAGLNGPTAGTSGVGTVNLRTIDFTPTNSYYAQAGADSYGGGFLTGIVNYNLSRKLSLILGDSFSGYNGPDHGQIVNGIAQNVGPNGAALRTGTYQAPSLTNNLVSFATDFSNTYNLRAELAKIRYRFSDATSLTGEFLGLQGRYDPQGGAYGQFYGLASIPQCLNGTGAGAKAGGIGAPAGAAPCTVTSAYNSPFVQNLVGQTNVPLYTFYQGSDVLNNQPNFNLDFRTSIKNDTLLFRPYGAGIRRLIEGSGESAYSGSGPNSVAQSFYQVTSNANCQVAFAAPVAGVGAKGPCYVPNVVSGAYLGANTGAYTAFPQVATLPNGYVCSATTPCYTQNTVQNNNGQWGFGAPYTTLEIDKLAGYTFSYIHPVHGNTFSLSVDHYYDDTQSFQNDFSQIVPGCVFTQTGGPPPTYPSGPNKGQINTNDPGYIANAGCNLIGANGGIVYKPTPIAVPETFSSVTDVSLTGQLQLTQSLELDLGGYFVHYRINAQREDPGFLSTFVAQQIAAGDNPNVAIAPIVLSGAVNSASHFDPHAGLIWRPNRDLAVRASAGSSLSIPYASIVSGLTTINSSPAGATVIASPNIGLKPEEVVSFDLGTDYRFPNGAVFSGDIYHTTVHSPFVTLVNTLAAPPPGFAPGILYQTSQQSNGPLERAYGLEFQAIREPQIGFGYRLQGSLQRAYYEGFDPTFYATGSRLVNGFQLLGVPYAKSYLELQYAGVKSSLVRLGMDWEGGNNSSNGPGYVVFDAGLRFQVAPRVLFNMNVDNLTNFGYGGYLARAVAFQGNTPLQQTCTAGTCVLSNAGSTVGLVSPYPRTFRFSLTSRF